MENKPLVSIVITSYNRAHWIGQAIESALTQDYENLEIIISDNASTDNSDEVIRSYCHDPRIKYSRNETNIGALGNFSKCRNETRGDYVTFISSDDFLTDRFFISDAVSIFNEYANTTLVYGRYKNVYENNNKIDLVLPPNNINYFKQKNRNGLEVFLDFGNSSQFGYGGCVLDANLLKQLPSNVFEFVFNDTITTYLLMLKGNVGFIDRYVYQVRIHDGNESSNFLSGTDPVAFFTKERFALMEYIYNEALKSEDTFFISKVKAEWYPTVFKRHISSALRAAILYDSKSHASMKDFIKKRYPTLSYNRFSDIYYLRNLVVFKLIKFELIRKVFKAIFPNQKVFQKPYR